MKEIIIDGENAVLGRLASFSAKNALEGNKITIVNSEKIIVVGRRDAIIQKYLWKKSLGGSNLSGPYIHANPEKITKRTIRGMLPYKQERGRLAMKRIRCYNGIPKEYENAKMIKSGKGSKGTKLEEVSRMMKG